MSDIDRRRLWTSSSELFDEAGSNLADEGIPTEKITYIYHESAVSELVEALRDYQDDHDNYVQHFSAETHQECECEQCQKINNLLAHYKDLRDEEEIG